MSDTLDILNSTLASSLRLWRGTRATRRRTSAEEVARTLRVRGLPILPARARGAHRTRPRRADLPIAARWHALPAESEGARGQAAVSVLGRSQHGTRAVRVRRDHRLPVRRVRKTPGADEAVAAVRRGLRDAREPCRAWLRAPAPVHRNLPRRPLELFSFESSPYSRRVRELLCELELPYVLRNAGKARWQDLGPPSLRATLFPDLPIEGRNRKALLERAGRVQLPYLIDPNTGVEMFESAEIRKYLLATYSRPICHERPASVSPTTARNRKASRRATGANVPRDEPVTRPSCSAETSGCECSTRVDSARAGSATQP